MMRKHISVIVFVALIFSFSFVPVVQAGDSTFNNGAGGNNWATAGNWTNGIAGTSDNAFITANVTSISSGVALLILKRVLASLADSAYNVLQSRESH